MVDRVYTMYFADVIMTYMYTLFKVFLNNYTKCATAIVCPPAAAKPPIVATTTSAGVVVAIVIAVVVVLIILAVGGYLPYKSVSVTNIIRVHVHVYYVQYVLYVHVHVYTNVHVY